VGWTVLSLTVPPHLQDEIIGDLEEAYGKMLQRGSLRAASLYLTDLVLSASAVAFAVLAASLRRDLLNVGVAGIAFAGVLFVGWFAARMCLPYGVAVPMEWLELTAVAFLLPNIVRRERLATFVAFLAGFCGILLLVIATDPTWCHGPNFWRSYLLISMIAAGASVAGALASPRIRKLTQI